MNIDNHASANQILVQKVVEGMKKEGFGRIVNIISTSVKAPIPGLGVSNTIRAAVANWAKTLSIEVGAYGITVNNVLPGFTNTNRLKSLITKKSEIQGKTEDEIAKAIVLYLVSGTPIISAATSWSRIAARARPVRVRAKFAAQRAKIVKRTRRK